MSSQMLKNNIHVAQGLVRICAIAILLSTGYAINFIAIIQAIVTGKLAVEYWAIIYVASSIWLFISCVLLITITLFGFKIQLLTKHNRAIALYFFMVGVVAHSLSLVLGVFFSSDLGYIRWQPELLYTLLPLYLGALIYFFNDRRFTQLINLILFSVTLFITPFLRLLEVVQFTQFLLPTPLPTSLLFSYAAICVATSLLICIHLICLFKHYNSGLFLKLLIIGAIMYGLVTIIRKKIDFFPYDAAYRMYYYYVLLTALLCLYCCELFIKGAKKIVRMDARSLAKSPSFDIQIENMETFMSEIENEPELKCIVELLKDSSGMSGMAASRNSVTSPLSALSPISAKLAGNSPLSLMNNNSSFSSFPYNSFANPNENIDSVVQIFPDFIPCKENRNKYFRQLIINDKAHANIDRVTDSISAIVPFYNEKASEIHATLRSLYFNFDYIKKKQTKYKFTHFNVLLVGDGWFKADISTKRYLGKLYNCTTEFEDNFKDFAKEKHKHNTVILQTKFNKKLCINPFKNDEKKLFLKVTTIIKIDNRKKANSHEWFLGRYGFAEWVKCDYMFFTDAYSTMNKEGLYQMLTHMKEPKNQDVVCCTGRARVYTIEQELDLKNFLREKHDPEEDAEDEKDKKGYFLEVPYVDAEAERAPNDDEEEKYQMAGDDDKFLRWWQNDIFQPANRDEAIDIMDEGDSGESVFFKIQDTEYDHRLTMNAHLRSCQTFEFEALYGTIGCYLLGGFLPVIPGPCGFYRSSCLLMDEVRGWYFEKINQTNDPLNIDLVLGNMKLAEDRILTISSILNSELPVRHSLIAECIFYFDPMPTLTQLMKQRRRWMNGSIATVIFVLRKISFSRWKVNIFRRYYVLSLWYMQLLMFIVVSLSPPLIFTISFEYGLASILDTLLVAHDDAEKNAKAKKITTITVLFMMLSWLVYLTFIYFAQRDEPIYKKRKFKWLKIKSETVVQITLVISFMFGSLILMGTVIQVANVFRGGEEAEVEENKIVTNAFNFVVILVEVTFFMQSFVLAPIVSKDFTTLTILLKTCFQYFLYAPFYVSFMFINAIANIHDLSWGTRPDKDEEKEEDDGANNPKQTTVKLLMIVLLMDVVIAVLVQPFTQYVYAHIIFFSFLAFPSLYQIFFTLLWLMQTRLFSDLWEACKPKKMRDQIEYVGLS